MTQDDQLERLLDGNLPARTRALLESAGTDAPPPDFSRHLLTGLGIGSAALLASGTAAASSALSAKSASPLLASVAAKWLLVGFVAGGAVVGGGSALIPSPHVSAPTPPVPTAVPQRAPALPAREPVVEQPAEPVEQKPAPIPVARVAPSSSASGQLGREVRLIDAVRRALATGNASLAASKLDEYRRTAQSGVLDREARVLHIETLLAQGNRARATELAHAYIAELPNDPHSARLRRLLGID